MPIGDIQKEWENAPQSFASWIPNVSGRISFSLAGQLGPQLLRHASEYFSQDNIRKVALEQARRNGDFPLLPIVNQTFRRKSSLNWYLVGETSKASYPIGINEPIENELGLLHGTIFAFGRHRVKSLRSACKKVRRVIWHKRIRYDAKKINDLIKENDLIVPKIQYCLFRNGELRVWLKQETIDLLAFEASATETEKELSQALVDQAFFFLKDMFHNHTHHAASDDQLVPICRTRPLDGGNTPIDAEKNWRRDILWSLGRIIKEYVRGHGMARLKKIEGLVAYGNAFQDNLIPQFRIPGGREEFASFDNIHTYDFDHINTSIRAEVSAETGDRQKYGQFITFVVATLIGIISLINTTATTLNSKFAESCLAPCHSRYAVNWPETFVRLVFLYPAQSAGLAAFITAMFYILLAKPFDLQPIRGPQRTMSRIAYSIAGSIYGAINRTFETDLNRSRIKSALYNGMLAVLGTLCLLFLGIALVGISQLQDILSRF